MELKDRERKVDLNSMTPAHAEAVSAQLGEKIRQICDEAVEKANKFLNVYGLDAKMQIVIDQKEQVKAQEAPKKKKGRPKKEPQSLS